MMAAKPHDSAMSWPNRMPGQKPGQKRSRDDEMDDDDDDGDVDDGSVQVPLTGPPVKPRGKPVYGPGMSLIYLEDPGYAAAAESQSGTWVEECAGRAQCQRPVHAKRPSVSTRKSQRVIASASASDELAHLVLPPTMRDVTATPLIDEATRALGISWTRMDSSEARRINQAAYAKWIVNHYPSLEHATVWFEYSATPCYLVAARNVYHHVQEFYIFSHDLTEARLVTSDPAQLVPRLKMLPALHLAAPGGHIRAEADIVSLAHQQANGGSARAEMAGSAVSLAAAAAPPVANEMELD